MFSYLIYVSYDKKCSIYTHITLHSYMINYEECLALYRKVNK